MEKTLSFADTSPQTIKIGDTNTSLTLICGNANVATDLTSATSITVKLGNASGYLESIQIDPTKLTNPKTGEITVKFDNDLMTSLPADNYAIEVWVVDSAGTSIYPSDWSTWFTINNNIQSTNGSTITTITFDDFVAAMNKAASTIAKGDKGDTGPQGPKGDTGMTDTTNFQKLKITKDNGEATIILYASSGQDLNNVLSSSNGMNTFVCQSGVTNNPSANTLRGISWVSNGFGYAIANTSQNDNQGDLWLANISAGIVKWGHLATQQN